MYKHYRFIELFLVVITSWWLIVLSLNQTLFHDRPELFYTFEKVGNQTQWTSVFLLSLLFHLLGLVWEKSFVHKVALIFSTFLYGTIAAGFILSKQPLSTGVGVYFAISLLALWGLREVKSND
ncbi:hypothetical protein [Priestia flexa]|uniref:hypothetical protein n=1 Tax=Priestia flexa TaxID=86664 RepID=UPI001B31A52B|nr:hypothetical protein [Priestia flexa]